MFDADDATLEAKITSAWTRLSEQNDQHTSHVQVRPNLRGQEGRDGHPFTPVAASFGPVEMNVEPHAHSQECSAKRACSQ